MNINIIISISTNINIQIHININIIMNMNIANTLCTLTIFYATWASMPACMPTDPSRHAQLILTQLICTRPTLYSRTPPRTLPRGERPPNALKTTCTRVVFQTNMCRTYSVCNCSSQHCPFRGMYSSPPETTCPPSLRGALKGWATVQHISPSCSPLPNSTPGWWSPRGPQLHTPNFSLRSRSRHSCSSTTIVLPPQMIPINETTGACKCSKSTFLSTESLACLQPILCLKCPNPLKVHSTFSLIVTQPSKPSPQGYPVGEAAAADAA